MNDDIQYLTARLLCDQHIPRSDRLAQRAIMDEAFRQELDRRLSACGLRLLDNPYAQNIALGLVAEAEPQVLSGRDIWAAPGYQLPRDGAALLTILWALLILPKREQQRTRGAAQEGASGDMFSADKPMPSSEAIQLAESALIADFGDKLGGKTRIGFNLGVLARLGFIHRHNKMIGEGPLLDLVLDYATLAPRILNSALKNLLAKPGSSDVSHPEH